jgi:hypothetical protein
VRYKKNIVNRVIKAFPIRQSHWPMGVPIRIANPYWPVGTPIGQWGSRLVSGSYCRTGWTRALKFVPKSFEGLTVALQEFCPGSAEQVIKFPIVQQLKIHTFYGVNCKHSIAQIRLTLYNVPLILEICLRVCQDFEVCAG